MLIADRRILGVRNRFIAVDDLRDLMRVPSDILKSVLFVAVKYGAGLRQVGTAFLIDYCHIGGDDHVEITTGCYCITARHVIDKPNRSEVFLTANLKEGGIGKIRVRRDHWLTLPISGQEYIDVAAFPMSDQEIDRFDLKVFPIILPEGDDFATRYDIGLGDDLFAVGLFTHRPGLTRNVPIIRSGMISAMPGEPIYHEGFEIDGYLAEMRSISGLSGSPIYASFDAPGAVEQSHPLAKRWCWGLVGLLTASWKVEETDAFERRGLTIVTPSRFIVDTIMQEDEVQRRKKKAVRIPRSEFTFEDVDLQDIKQKQREVDLTKQDFDKALKRAARKRHDEGRTNT